MYTCGAHVSTSTRSHAPWSMRTRARASRERTGTMTNGTPHEAVPGAHSPSSSSASSSPITRAKSAEDGGGGPNSGACAAVSCAKVGRPGSRVMRTATGPTVSSRTMCWTSSGTAPVSASSTAVPTVGCPANGSSTAGVKMRSFRVPASVWAGSTKTVSDRFNSAAMRCICPVERPWPSGKTASGLPPNTRSVNTSSR